MARSSKQQEKQNYLYSCISKHASKSIIEEFNRDVSSYKRKKTSSVSDLPKINKPKNIIVTNLSGIKNSTQIIITQENKLPSHCNEISSTPQDNCYEESAKKDQIHSVVEKFKIFKDSVNQILITTKKFNSKDQRHNEFMIKQKKKLFSQGIVMKIIFNSWKSHVLKKKLKYIINGK